MDTNEAVQSLRWNGPEQKWSRAVAAESGIRVTSCYQCLRCTNGCPVSTLMEIKPHEVVRLVQLGRRDELLESSTPWICLSCEMCSTYCPNEIDVAGLMNYLKNTVVSSLKKPALYEVAAFHEAFLSVLGRYGRMERLRTPWGVFKWKSLLNQGPPGRKEMIEDMSLAWSLLKRGRLGLFPDKAQGCRRGPAFHEATRQEEDFPMTSLSFYPGCALQHMSRDYRNSLVEVAGALDIELEEIPDWTCCGASAAHTLDEHMSENPAGAKPSHRPSRGPRCRRRLAPCASSDSASRIVCSARSGWTAHWKVDKQMEIVDLARLFASEPWMSRISERVVSVLDGLRVVCYYGCPARCAPPRITGATDYPNPLHLDRIVAATGGARPGLVL